MKRMKLGFMAIIFTVVQFTFAQPSEIDSLQRILPLSQGQDRFNVLIELFKTNLTRNYDSALYYSTLAVTQARQNGDSLSMVKAYNAKGWVRYFPQ